MQIRDLYKHYQVMPQLQTHMLRVAGIVKLITKDQDSILTALVHDLGNIVKFDNLDEAWSKVQKECVAKYGRDAHVATAKMLEEAGLDKLKKLVEEESEFYRNIMQIDDFSKANLPAVLTLYGDSRVAMGGVVTLEERIVDLETRYGEHRNDRVWGPKLEAYVQTLTDTDIRAIKESDVEPLFDELLTYELE